MLRVLSIGGGNMASAILTGAVHAGVVPPDRVSVVDPNESARSRLTTSLGVRCEPSINQIELGTKPNDQLVVLLGVKPQVFPAIAQELAAWLGAITTTPSTPVTLLSVMAGLPAAHIHGSLGRPDHAAVVRVMPNTPASVGKGICALADDTGADQQQYAAVESLLRSTGEVIRMPESHIDAFTGVAGSGPAYVFAMVETLATAGVLAGLSEAAAARAARQTVIGAAALLEHTDADPADLRRAVTSPNGTTQAGLVALAQAGFADAIERAVFAARDRGVSLAQAAASNSP